MIALKFWVIFFFCDFLTSYKHAESITTNRRWGMYRIYDVFFTSCDFVVDMVTSFIVSICQSALAVCDNSLFMVSLVSYDFLVPSFPSIYGFDAGNENLIDSFVHNQLTQYSFYLCPSSPGRKSCQRSSETGNYSTRIFISDSLKSVDRNHCKTQGIADPLANTSVI